MCFICFPNTGLHICSSGGHLTRGSTALELLDLCRHLKLSSLSGIGQTWHLNDFLCRHLNGFYWLVHEYSKCQNEKKKKPRPCLGQLGFMKQTKTTADVSDDKCAGAPTNVNVSEWELLAAGSCLVLLRFKTSVSYVALCLFLLFW